MVFSSLTFLYLFLPLAVLPYFLVKSRTWRNGLLLVLSLFFYAWGEPKYVVMMLAATVVAYAGGLAIETLRGRPKACVLDLIPMAVLILFFALINQLVKGSSLTVLLCVVCYVALVVFGTYMPSVGGLVFTGYLRWHNLWIGVTLPFLSLLPRIGLLAGYGLVFGCGGYLLFDRKEA